MKRAIPALAAAIFIATAPAHAQGTLRIAMTASDIPLTTGQTDNGGEGMRFMGYTVYDALINWDLSSATKPSGLMPGLATSWAIDEADASKTKWIFKLREGVKFHDGSDFTADAVVWNLDKITKKDSPQFDPRQSGQGLTRIPAVAAYQGDRQAHARNLHQGAGRDAAVSDRLDHDVVAGAVGEGRQDLGRVRAHAVRHRPVEARQVRAARARRTDPQQGVLGQGARAEARPADAAAVAGSERACRALRSGQVDWIEAPPPDAVPSLKSAGMQIVTNAYPHNWTWHLSRAEGSPWNDVRVRKAANLAIDRQGMKEMLSGLMIPAEGFFPPGHQWFGNPSFKLKHDVAAAKKLMAEAGYGPGKPLKTKILISASGSGQMQPLPMNEFVQQSLAEIGIQVELEVVDWNTLINIWRAGAKHETSRGATGMNYTYFLQDPFTGFIRHVQCSFGPPAGTNWGYYCDPEMDKLLDQVRNTFDPAAQTKVLEKIHEKYVDEALFLMVTHDVNPRAMSTKVKGFVQAQNWFQDFSPVSMAP